MAKMLRRSAFLFLTLMAVGPRPSAQVNVRDTRLLHQPATNGTHVAFVYADDLWVARARRHRPAPADDR